VLIVFHYGPAPVHSICTHVSLPAGVATVAELTVKTMPPSDLVDHVLSVLSVRGTHKRPEFVESNAVQEQNTETEFAHVPAGQVVFE